MVLKGCNIGEIGVKGQRSCKIWQSLKKDVNAHGFVIIIHRKLIFGRMTEDDRGLLSHMRQSCWGAGG